MSKTEFDKLFKKGLEEYEIAPNLGSFDRINGELSKKAKLRETAKIASLIIILLIGFAAYFLADNISKTNDAPKTTIPQNQYASSVDIPASTEAEITNNEVGLEQNNQIYQESIKPPSNRTVDYKRVKQQTKSAKLDKSMMELAHGEKQLITKKEETKVEVANNTTNNEDVITTTSIKSEVLSPELKIRLNRPSKLEIQLGDVVQLHEEKEIKKKNLFKFIENSVENGYTAFLERNYENSESRKNIY